ncbi:EscD/YscD/HrpQ family type III secretion system periplasmic domain-containing protein [Ideonella sp. DXS29W]|uniref:EscD/YscD/HrpQ family type III secretion system periplasmic domain-containing protein n=1 Tax=Ideonella lacteola TaxID=2984193 RepID=A0ABU9BM07_9BURK
MTLELRILSGMHRGVCLPIDDETPLTLGGQDDCDVMLVDPALQDQSWTILVHGDAWSGGPTDAEAAPQRRAIGAVLDVSGVRVLVCAADAAWNFDLPDAGGSAGVSGDDLPDIHSLRSELPRDMPQVGAPLAAADAAKPGARPPIDPTTLKNCTYVTHDASRGRLLRRAALGAVIAGAAGVALSNARTSSSEVSEVDQRIKAALAASETSARWAAPVLAGQAASAAALSSATAVDPAASGAAGRAVSDLDELRLLLQQRLEAADLFRRLDINTSGSPWVLSGDLNAEDEQRLARVVAQFTRDYKPRVEIQAKVLSAEELLPFDIKQLMSGQMASVVTTDDVRLFPGDTHRGYTLAKIDGRRITFVGGKRTIEVVW